jgi:alkanesulfonate monooxygenase SsuD/methylene tetrahydromethanopterin reductase-like flavin-dependent oxidoreductase (luciferase family)
VRAGNTFSPFGRRSVDLVDHHHIDDTLNGSRSCIFHGKQFNFGPVKRLPNLFRNGVPIVIGGHSPAAAKRAGRYGDRYFPAIAETEKLKELLAW